MRSRFLGKTGFKVSEVGLGCWQLGGDFGPVSKLQADEILTQAHQHQISFWDTADVYGDGMSESIIGEWRRRHLNQSELKVATKVGRSGRLFPDKFTKFQVQSDIQASAKRLGVECIDLIQLHCIPAPLLEDGEVFSWLQDFKQQGLIQHYGASVETVEEGLTCLKDPNLATLQIIFNLFRQDAIDKLLPKAADNNVGIIVRLPLASGLLSGKFKHNQSFAQSDHRHYNCDGQAFNVGETFSGLPMNKGVELVEGLKHWLPEDCSLAVFALRWILDHPQVSTVIAGVSKPEQVALNCLASTQTVLNRDTHQAIQQYYRQEIRQHIRGPI
jgi:aryl-alcohol dehydrogenase-like predicted oxidoreductase